MKPIADLIIENAVEVITCEATGSDLLGRIRGGSVAIAGERILTVGSGAQVRGAVDASRAHVIDVSGKIVAPGFVDCHSHLVFGKSRVKEYALRMTLSPDEVKALGILTGIAASIQMTRETSEDELFESSVKRIDRMLAAGTTTLESKSGYGINRSDELKMLRVNKRLNAETPVDIISTFLGAHDFPPEIDRFNKNDRDRYIETLINDMIPEVAELGLAEFCDVYCDIGYYTVEESRRILEAGIGCGLKAKIHTDAYAGIGGSRLAAELHAISADHLNYTQAEEMAAMADAGVVGVVLPALDFAVAHPKRFDPRKMINKGMNLALATNLNPGNWTESMQFVMVLACRNHGMSPEEAMLASTVGGAKALCREEEIGSISKGKLADIQIWDLSSFEDIIYRLGSNSVHTVVKRGQICFSKQLELYKSAGNKM